MDTLSVRDLRFLDYGPMSIQLQTGNILGISGPSGSGKSLLLRAVADLIDSEGDVNLLAENRWSLAPADWRSRVMLVPAEAQWWFETVGEHLPDGAEPFWQKLGFEDEVLSKSVIELSSGEKQRLGLVRALCRQPDVLLLDEPTANLDSGNTGLVEDCIQNFLNAGNRVAVWVSHDEAQLGRVATHSGRMTDKQLRLEVEV